MADYFLGIDPGVNGALVVLTEGGGCCAALQTPVVATGKGTRRIVDGKTVYGWLAGGPKWYRLCVIEKQQTMPRDGRVSAFTTGRGYGRLEMALEIAGIPFQAARSQVWKKAMGVVGTGKAGKDAALVVARGLWPNEPLLAEKKPHDGVVDALLIAEYARRLHVGSAQ